MTTNAKILELPLHLVGISDQVADWLRQAGISVLRLGQESTFGQTSGQANPPMARPVRCLLYDSRDVWSRSLLKSYHENSDTNLDIARLMSSTARNRKKCSERFVFLEQFKTALEEQGGLWARLADYPFPYRGVGCVDEGHARFPRDRRSSSAHRLEAIRERYIAGLPVSLSAKDLSRLAELPPVGGLQSPGLPLLWRAEQTDFAAWWEYRYRLELTLWQTPTHYHVQCSKTNSSFCPVLEIWRGNHMASVPLRSESLVVRKDGLVFQKQPVRHPAGLTAVWPDSMSGAGASCLSA